MPNWGYIIAAFGSLFAFFAAVRDKNAFRPIMLSSVIFGYFLFFHAVVQSMDRYRFPAEPILIVMTAFFIDNWIKKKAGTHDPASRHHEA